MSRDGPARAIALINQKGGVGKTTTAVCLSAALAEAGRRVLLVDLDPQAHATLHLGADVSTSHPSVYDLLLDPTIPIEQIILHARPALDLIPSETDLAAAETELAAAPRRQQRLRDRLAPLVDRYDFLIIDCPPSLGLLTINGLVAAGDVLIPMQAHFLALQGVGKLLETVRLVASGANPRLRVLGVVLCMHDAQTTLGQEVVADLEAFFARARSTPVPWRDACVLRPWIRRNIKLAESPGFGKTVFEYAPSASGAADYRALAEAVVQLADTPPAEPQSPSPQVVVVDARTGRPA